MHDSILILCLLKDFHAYVEKWYKRGHFTNTQTHIPRLYIVELAVSKTKDMP